MTLIDWIALITGFYLGASISGFYSPFPSWKWWISSFSIFIAFFINYWLWLVVFSLFVGVMSDDSNVKLFSWRYWVMLIPNCLLFNLFNHYLIR